MDISQTINLYITYVDKEGPFLKVWGQTEKTNSIFVEQFLLSTTEQFDQGFGKLPIDSLLVGTLVCAKYKDNKYYRARITNVSLIRDYFVEVSFLDYGNKDIVPCDNVRSVQNFPPSFISIPPLANGFIFAEAHCPGGGEWNEALFENIAKDIRYQDVQCKVLAQATQYYLIKLYINNTDIGSLLIGRGLMQPISLQAQQAVLLSMSMQKRQVAASSSTPAPEINTFKACQLEPGAQYPVYVSYVNDGPTLFSVQLRQSEDILVKLMKDINAIDLRPLEEVPLPGTICLARCQEDGNICRAVVTNEVDQQFKVFYVDFGNQEVVPLDALYTIPFKYVLPKVMAIRFGLAGVEKSTVTLEMSCAFKNFVDNRLLHMKVLPSITRTSVQKCELWDPQTKTSALDVLNRAARHAYPEPLALNRATSQPVKVSFVYSCNRFYVQLVSKEAELSKLMNDLQVSCVNSDPMDPSDIRVGLPCCALFEADQLWYRSEIVEIVDGAHVKVRYIDYGNEEVVPITHMRMVEGELLTVLRPQAIECCLNGYQNMEPNLERDGFLEELILEQTFTMKVAEMTGKKALVELIDSANYNVASLLLDKIAFATSQVSPLLVQAGNRIEHRKMQNGPRSDSGGGYRDHSGGRPARESGKGWNDRNEKSNEKSWRQENKDRQNRNYERDSNSNDESPESTWRQNNKGFNRNRDNGNDRFNRDNNRFGTTDGDRFSKPNNRFGKDSDRFNKEDKLGNENDRFNKDNRFGKENDRFNKDGDRFGRGKFNKNDNKFDKFNRDNNRNANDWKSNDNATNNSGDIWGEDSATPAAPETGDDGWNDSGHSSASTQKTPRYRSDGERVGRFNNADRPPRRDTRDGNEKPGFKKRSEFRKDGSEISSSGSEKSFQRGPRTSSRNDRGERRFNKRDNNFAFSSPPADNSWNVSSVTTSINAASPDAAFTLYDVVGTESKVVISWFHNPSHFYCQLIDTQGAFKTMMEEIQKFYKNRPPESTVVGAPVIGLFPEDNVLYRAQVLEVIGAEYKVFYVDFGNVSVISKLWPIEKKFMNLPAQALCCSLAGVMPLGDTWPNADNYGKYFEKESLVARFVNKDYENKLYVNLFDESSDIASQLVQNGLACAEQLEPQVEVPLLLSQQFRVIIKSVNNLNDIIVALECGLALSCRMHNVDTATETYEDTLKGYLEQTVITFVDNVLEDNRLEVTFYDNDGNKLTILNPDEGAFDTVEPLCPSLIFSSTLAGYVSHVDESSVYIQPSQYADIIVTYLEKLFEFYDPKKESSSIIPEDGMFYAVRSEDENWYRARVTSFDDEKATVCYIDYGNSENVPFASLRELDKQFMVPNMMCLQVHVTVPSAPLLDKNVLATIYYGELGWEGTIQDLTSTQEPPVTDVPAETISEVAALEQPIVECDELRVESIETPALLSEVPTAIESASVVEQKGVPVVVSHTDSPNEFYVQLLDASSAVDELQARLQDEAPNMPVLENITAGVLCAAPYSVDLQWYRAEVLDADDDITTVRFIDYGNTDVINNQSTQIKTLPPELLTLAVYATRCSLKAKPIEEEWSAMALEVFEQLTVENTSADFQDQDEKTHYVELYANGQNVRDVLIQQNFALPAELVGDNKSNCFISHLNSPSEFWIQLESCVDDLEWIAEQLSGAHSFPELEDLAPGTLCAALFPDDEMWYRARILSNTVAGIELLFIDYGNSCTSNSLRQLPEDLVVTPPLAQKCSLQRPSGFPYWTPQACGKFSEISADGQTIFTVKKVNTGETATVELLVNGEDIVNKLLPLTEEGIVGDFVSLEQFTVETSKGKVEHCKLEAMPGTVWDNSATQKFMEINKEGTKFQVEFIDEKTARFYLDQNDIRPSLGGVKISILNVSPTKEVTTTSSDKIIDHLAGGDQSSSIENHDDSNFCSGKTTSESISEKGPVTMITPDSAIEELIETKKNISVEEGEAKLQESSVKDECIPKVVTLDSAIEELIEMKKNTSVEAGEARLQESSVKDGSIPKMATPDSAILELTETKKNTSVEEGAARPQDSLVKDESIPKMATPDSTILKLTETNKNTSVEEEAARHQEYLVKDESIPTKAVSEIGTNEIEEKTEVAAIRHSEESSNVEVIDIIPSPETEDVLNTNESEGKPPSRPESRQSLNHDERIVPAALSRPQTPFEEESDGKEENDEGTGSEKSLNDSLTESINAILTNAIESALTRFETEVRSPDRSDKSCSLNEEGRNILGIISEECALLEEKLGDKVIGQDTESEKGLNDFLTESINAILTNTIESALTQFETEVRLPDRSDKSCSLNEEGRNIAGIISEECDLLGEKLGDKEIDAEITNVLNNMLMDAVESVLNQKELQVISHKWKNLSHDDKIVPGIFSLHEIIDEPDMECQNVHNADDVAHSLNEESLNIYCNTLQSEEILSERDISFKDDDNNFIEAGLQEIADWSSKVLCIAVENNHILNLDDEFISNIITMPHSPVDEILEPEIEMSLTGPQKDGVIFSSSLSDDGDSNEIKVNEVDQEELSVVTDAIKCEQFPPEVLSEIQPLKESPHKEKASSHTEEYDSKTGSCISKKSPEKYGVTFCSSLSEDDNSNQIKIIEAEVDQEELLSASIRKNCKQFTPEVLSEIKPQKERPDKEKVSFHTEECDSKTNSFLSEKSPKKNTVIFPSSLSEGDDDSNQIKINEVEQEELSIVTVAEKCEQFPLEVLSQILPLKESPDKEVSSHTEECDFKTNSSLNAFFNALISDAIEISLNKKELESTCTNRPRSRRRSDNEERIIPGVLYRFQNEDEFNKD